MLSEVHPKERSYITRGKINLLQSDAEHIVLRVSIEARSFQGSRFESIIHFLSNIKRTIPQTVLISDTLERFNFVSVKNLSLKEALECSKVQGNTWYKKHSYLLRHLKNSVRDLSILWWEPISTEEGFYTLNKKMSLLYKSDTIFKNRLDRDVERYVNCRRQAGLDLDWKKFYEESVKLLLEELTVHKMIYDRFGGYHLYPSDQLKSEAYLSNTNAHIDDDLRFPPDSYIRLKVENSDNRKNRN